MKFNVKYIDDKEISDEFAKLIKHKVIHSLNTDNDDIVIKGIHIVEPHNNETVELKVNLNSGEKIVISFERLEFNRLHSIDPDKIVFGLIHIGDVKLSNEQCAIIKKNLIYMLEDPLNSDGYGDFRRCEIIKITEIRYVAPQLFFHSGKVCLELDIMYECPIDGHQTPDMTNMYHLCIDKSEFPLDMRKQRYIGYTNIKEQELPEEDIIVLEKIDGSNLGIGFIDDRTILIQSKNRVLALLSCSYYVWGKTAVEEQCPGYWKGHEKKYNVEMVHYSNAKKIIAPRKFFNLEFIIDELVQKIINIRRKDLLNCPFMVFGELFGSSKHPKKDNKKKSHLLQYHSEESERMLKTDKVFYSAFDILVNNTEYLRYSDVINIFEQVELPYSKVLPIKYCGNEGILADIETLKSQYAEELAEGVVIKKNTTEPKHQRTITKLKRKTFNETRGKIITVDNFLTINRLANSYTKCGGDEEETIDCFIRDVEEAIITSLRKKIVKNSTTYAKNNIKNIRN